MVGRRPPAGLCREPDRHRTTGRPVRPFAMGAAGTTWPAARGRSSACQVARKRGRRPTRRRGPVGAGAPRAGAGSLWRSPAGKLLIDSHHMREAAPMPEPELEGLTNFLYEMGLLKRYKRTGWMIAGIDNPESI